MFAGRLGVKTAALSGGGLRTPTISGVDVLALLRHGIRLDSPVEIDSPVAFAQPVVARNVEYFHSISGKLTLLWNHTMITYVADRCAHQQPAIPPSVHLSVGSSVSPSLRSSGYTSAFAFCLKRQNTRLFGVSICSISLSVLMGGACRALRQRSCLR